MENKTLKYENGDVFLASRNFNRKFFNSSCCFFRILLEKLSRAKNWNSYQSFVNRKIASWTLIFKLWGKIEISALNFLHEICKRILFNFFAEKVARGNSVQIAPNFPAKSLSIYTTAFSTHPFDKLIETQLTTKIFEKK